MCHNRHSCQDSSLSERKSYTEILAKAEGREEKAKIEKMNICKRKLASNTLVAVVIITS